jgi:hypothetical protein
MKESDDGTKSETRGLFESSLMMKNKEEPHPTLAACRIQPKLSSLTRKYARRKPTQNPLLFSPDPKKVPFLRITQVDLLCFRAGPSNTTRIEHSAYNAPTDRTTTSQQRSWPAAMPN